MQFVFFAIRAKPSSMRRAVAMRLARTHSVVIVTEAASLARRPGLVRRAARATGTAAPGAPCELTPLHLPTRVPLVGGALERIDRALLTREFADVADPFGKSGRVVFYDSPSQNSLVGRLGENRSIYLAIDDRTVTVAGEDIPGEKAAERRLLAAVDQVICVSEPLAETLRRRVPERPELRIDVVTNGYDEELFIAEAAPPEPVALADVPRPRILVAGHVSDRIDWDGIAAFAAARPDVAFVFLGPADKGMGERIAALAAESGAPMRLLPPVAHATVPAFVAHADVCAAPYHLNAFTRASSPLKVVEYLGAGAPVVTTRIAALEPFGDVVYPVEEGDGDSYRRAVEAALADGRAAQARARRVAAAAPHSWSRKAAEVVRLVTGEAP